MADAGGDPSISTATRCLPSTPPLINAEPDEIAKEACNPAPAAAGDQEMKPAEEQEKKPSEEQEVAASPRKAGAQLLLKAAEEKDKDKSVQVNADFQAVLIGRLRELFQAQDASCDLKLVSEDGTEKRIHSVVALAMTSGAGKLTLGSGGVVNVSGVSGAVLSEIVSYMYTGELNISTETAGDLLKASQELGVRGAGELCGRYLNRSITATNALKRYVTAIRSGLSELQEGTLLVIDSKFEQVAATKDWLDLEAAQVRAILGRNSLNLGSEDKAFDALIAWRDHSPSDRISAFMEMFKDHDVVRLSLLEPKTVADLDTDQHIVSSPEATAAVKAELHRRILGDPPMSKARQGQTVLKTAKAKFCKQKVKKTFGTETYIGKIVDAEIEDETGKVLLRVEYNDGDLEDVYQEEAEAMIKAAKARPSAKSPAAKGKSPAAKGKSPKPKAKTAAAAAAGPAKKKRKT